jgi:hypothetical protein
MEKFWGLNVKLRRPGIFGIYRIIFLKKNLSNRSTVRGPGPRGWFMGPWDSLNTNRSIHDLRSRLKIIEGLFLI